MKQIDLHKIQITIPYIVKNENIDTLISGFITQEFFQITTNYGNFTLGFLKNTKTN
ncbi:MAG: hypothetical protein IE909_02055 [Campylobacterales bacterium]|nr:hypothetical protein [Campylobacterales bacterium]